MAKAQLEVVVRHIRGMVDAQTLAAATDGQLVERFASGHEEPAFAALLRRHGPMVFGVCRGVLRQVEDAEDVFQATFLLLARKAGSIRKRESVASWLHGVAYRLAVRAKAQGAFRRAQERKASAMRKTDRSVEEAWRELRPVLDEEMESSRRNTAPLWFSATWRGRPKKRLRGNSAVPSGRSEAAWAEHANSCRSG